MNKSNLKSYAPQARKDFIAAVTARAHLLGLDDQHGQLKVAPAQTQGDVTLIAGQAWPAKVDGQRQQLIARMQREGFAQTVEAVAYTWFNRFAALRYMELHDYLGHGHRALSSRDGGLPEILAHASELAQAGDLPGLKPSQVNELKLAGNRDGELYRLLLIAQCNALHQAMPFLFEHIDDETELLLPDNLLLSDSVIAKLVAEIPEEDWAEVEIIGWLYQFYISEKKEQVIGKVVKSEDIPAATQLFTPNWIVQYLVQNSIGRLWLMANPGSTLASQWPYYIQPAEQTPEVQAQLDALIQTRVREDGETLNPETITVLDPACGSGHILVVAYDVLKAIYLERGYSVALGAEINAELITRFPGSRNQSVLDQWRNETRNNLSAMVGPGAVQAVSQVIEMGQSGLIAQRRGNTAEVARQVQQLQQRADQFNLPTLRGTLNPRDLMLNLVNAGDAPSTMASAFLTGTALRNAQ